MDIRQKRTIIVIWLILSNFLLFFGGTLHPLVAGEQLIRRTKLPALIDPLNPDVQVLNKDFETFLLESEQVVKTRDNFDSLEAWEVNMIEIFTYLQIKHKSDLMQYLTVDHLPTVSEVIQSGVDDCDGRAILAANLLLYRGYDVWVLAHPLHYWVEVILEKGMTLSILDKNGIDNLYMRFNYKETTFNYFYVIGFILYEWVLVSILLIFLFYFHKTFYTSPFIRMTAKALAFVIVVTQIIYFGALGVVLLLYRIICFPRFISKTRGNHIE